MPDTNRKALRYRAYFWLMDASTVALGIGAADFIVDKLLGAGFESFVPSPWIYAIAVPVLVFNFIVPMLLVVARFMRDDYAEGLWRRSMLVLGHGVALGPIALLVASWLLFLAIGPKPPVWFGVMIEPRDPLQVLLYLWEARLILFVFAFQFLRWRDSR